MTWQRILLHGCTPTVSGYALGAYRPLYIWENGEKSRNPAFDNHSQQVLNLKSPERAQYFGPAVAYSAGFLTNFLRENVQLDRAEILIVPSSTKGKTSIGLEKIVQQVCSKDKRFSYQAGALSRHTTIDKLAKGGDRSLNVHLASMNYQEKRGSPRVKILLDDVMTSGNSLSGAITVMSQVVQGLVVVPIVLGKTTHD